MGKICPKKITTLKNTGGTNKSKRFPDIHCIAKDRLNKLISIITVNSKRSFVSKANEAKLVTRTSKDKIHRIDKALRIDIVIFPTQFSLF